MSDLRGGIALFAFLILWGTVGALECNDIGYGQFWIQSAACIGVIYLATTPLWYKRRK